MPGEYAWKLIKEQKNREGDEMAEIEARLNAIYAGVDPKKVGLLTCGTAARTTTKGPAVGTLLQYEEKKRLSAPEDQSSSVLLAPGDQSSAASLTSKQSFREGRSNESRTANTPFAEQTAEASNIATRTKDLDLLD